MQTAAATAPNEATRHYFCEIVEINGGYEYVAKFLLKAEPGQDADERFNEIIMNMRGNGEEDESGLIWYDDALAAKDASMDEITEAEFAVLSKYLTVN